MLPGSDLAFLIQLLAPSNTTFWVSWVMPLTHIHFHKDSQPSKASWKWLRNPFVEYRYAISESLTIMTKTEMMSIWCFVSIFIHGSMQHPEVQGIFIHESIQHPEGHGYITYWTIQHPEVHGYIYTWIHAASLRFRYIYVGVNLYSILWVTGIFIHGSIQHPEVHLKGDTWIHAASWGSPFYSRAWSYFCNWILYWVAVISLLFAK